MRKMIGLIAVLALITGCIETSTCVKVKKDGSGTILLKAYFDQEAVKKMAGGAAGMMGDMMGEAMGEMTAEITDPTGKNPKTAEETKDKIKKSVKKGLDEGMGKGKITMSGPKSFYNEKQARKLAIAFGKSVKFVKGKEISHKDGRKGFGATYAFDDITKVVVGQAIGDIIVESMEEKNMSMQPETMMDAYRFTFKKKGDSSILSIKPLPTNEEMEKIWMADASPEAIAEYRKSIEEEKKFSEEESTENNESDIKMDPKMEEQMMFGPYKGKKETISIIVDGEIIFTNTSCKSKGNQKGCILISMDYDKMLSSQKGRELLKKAQDMEIRRDFIKEARKTKIPGFIAEDPAKTVVINFK